MRVANRLDKIRKDFIWGGIGDETKFHLVNWNKICTPLYTGGLGVHISSSSIELFWVSGCGDMVGRERLYGVW